MVKAPHFRPRLISCGLYQVKPLFANVWINHPDNIDYNVKHERVYIYFRYLLIIILVLWFSAAASLLWRLAPTSSSVSEFLRRAYDILIFIDLLFCEGLFVYRNIWA